MTHDQAIKERDKALRESQLDLYHLLQGELNEISIEMLGNKEWKTENVDRSLQELLDEITDHFGMEADDD